MARSKKTDIGNIATTITGIVGTVSTMLTIGSDLFDKLTPADSKITVPDLYGKEFRLTKDEAEEVLRNLGLKPVLHKLLIQEADAKYKDCFDLQVIDSNPRSRQNVLVGSPVVITYITQDVIDESRRLFDELEKCKAKKNVPLRKQIYKILPNRENKKKKEH